LILLNVDNLDEEVVGDSLSTILKYEGDLRKAGEELQRFLRERKGEPDVAAGDGKELLH